MAHFVIRFGEVRKGIGIRQGKVLILHRCIDRKDQMPRKKFGIGSDAKEQGRDKQEKYIRFSVLSHYCFKPSLGL